MNVSVSSSLPLRPSVAFVLATHNRGPVMIDCLARVLACGLPATQFSIAIVDNASTDGTPELLESFVRQHPDFQINLFRLKQNRGPVAKNIALQKAVAEGANIVVLLDDDAYPLPGAIPQMLRHFHDDATLGAAVFDVTLPDGAREGSAYPDIFIGAGTALRAAALKAIPRTTGENVCAGLPVDFFMQAEEYDLSFRLLAGGWSVQRFWDMPLMHLKTPGARIGQRTTRLDVRNNLYILARYLPEPLCHQLAADWLARYWHMARTRDTMDGGTAALRSSGTAALGCDCAAALNGPLNDISATHRAAFTQGAAEGLQCWSTQRARGQVLTPPVIERIFKFQAIETRLRRARDQMGLRSIALADWGKNIFAYHRAARNLGLGITAVVDDNLAALGTEYRDIPVIPLADLATYGSPDALVLTVLSPVHARRRVEALRRVCSRPVIDLFGRAQATGVIISPSQKQACGEGPCSASQDAGAKSFSGCS